MTNVILHLTEYHILNQKFLTQNHNAVILLMTISFFGMERTTLKAVVNLRFFSHSYYGYKENEDDSTTVDFQRPQ